MQYGQESGNEMDLRVDDGAYPTADVEVRIRVSFALNLLI